MLNRLRAPVWVAAIFLVLSGCSDITAPRLLTSFDWGEVEVPEDIVPGVATSVALGQLFILGQFQTPTQCYVLDAEFRQNGTNLTVKVTAEPTGAPNCDESMGGFRYTAVVRNLKFGTYDFRVIHDIVDGAGVEYTKTVTIK